MNTNFEHYISNSLKSMYRRKLFSPAIYLLILVALWFLFPISSILFPAEVSEKTALEELYRTDRHYVKTTLTDLKFTGYTQQILGQTTGYYYYKMEDGICNIVLLSPRTCEEGLPNIAHVTIRAKVNANSGTYRQLLSALAKDLNWTDSGIYGKTANYYLSEPGIRYGASVFLILVYGISGIYALINLISYIVYILFPHMAPACRQLARFGSPKRMLAQAEHELATLPQLATEDMFITEHYFIEISASGIAFVPIRRIVWIYKHSTLHKFFWYHFSISYTLCIFAGKHLYIRCPKNQKSDIDGIIDYLAEANHNILVGFDEKNRRKVQELLGTPAPVKKILAFLKRRI
ncbi:MAG: hypothetical protein IJ567_10900 [Lachnospiraceae bacterium]|nr:hypothetical protein [Lachnospiraceae bacterium]